MTSAWRARILASFIPGAAPLTLAADPEGLLFDEEIVAGLAARGFELVPFDDSIAFRYEFETRFRSRDGATNNEPPREPVVAVRGAKAELDRLPYDLIQAGRKLTFSLGELFPRLSYPVVAAVDVADLDTLFAAQAQERPERLGDNATADFILRHVFHFAPEQARGEADILRFMLRLHYQGRRIPALLRERLIQAIGRVELVQAWPLQEILSDRDAFYSFLQERWPIFLDTLRRPDDERVQDRPQTPLRYGSPAVLPFDDPDVRVYIDTLFLEGTLTPATHPQSEALADHWVTLGIVRDAEGNRRHRLERLADAVAEQVPGPEARHGEWLRFARRWAELILRRESLRDGLEPNLTEKLDVLQSRVDEAFADWLPRRYGALYNQPADPPAMAHQIARVLARYVAEDSSRRVALLVFDGMALDQWLVVRDIVARRSGRAFHEGAVFTWVPTLTPVARQAIFSGRPPHYFPDSIDSSDRDGQAWTQFWKAQGLAGNECGYLRKVRDTPDLSRVEDLVSIPRHRAVGIVVDTIDRIMHGMQLGTRGMHNQTRQWAEEGFAGALFDLLDRHGYRIFITSDHGNIEAVGMGRPAEGAVAERRGERVRVYRNEATRTRVREDFPFSVSWPPISLPPDYLALLASGRRAFVPTGERVVAHGGISVEELIVPFVQIERRGT